METISLVQPNFQQGPRDKNAHYLPYSIGMLWAYVKDDDVVTSNLKLNQIIWHREDVKTTAQKLSQDKIIGFSCYIWNKNYNYALAKEIKKINPNVILLFGGPEIQIENPNVYHDFPFMDIIVKGEGEITFKKTISQLIDSNYELDIDKLSTIKGLLLDNNENIIDTGKAARIGNLTDLPSPYLTGVFDQLIKDTKHIEWNATLETNRGCPYACTFCDWGSLTYNKVKTYDLDRVFAELEWIGKHKCGFMSICDANFGMFFERDNAIADKIIEVQAKYGYPYYFTTSWAKNQKKEVVEIVRKFIDAPGMRNQGLNISVQSMDHSVLENIKRKNLEQHHIEEVFKLCDKANIHVYTEIILGLPGETLTSWKRNFWKLFNAGNHTGITILHAQLLVNAEMTLTQVEKFGITSIEAYDYMAGSYQDDEIAETVKIVTSTKHLPAPDMMRAHMFNWFIQTFHIDGLTTYIARFLNKFAGVTYEDFYSQLESYILRDHWWNKQHALISKQYEDWMSKGKIEFNHGYPVDIYGWNLVLIGTIALHSADKYEDVFRIIEDFMIENYSFMGQPMLSQLCDFNKHYVIDYAKLESYPIIKTYEYDFLGYILYDCELNQTTSYRYLYKDGPLSLRKFLEGLFFYRRKNFGKAVIEPISQE